MFEFIVMLFLFGFLFLLIREPQKWNWPSRLRNIWHS
jgi:hypothetical protein